MNGQSNDGLEENLTNQDFANLTSLVGKNTGEIDAVKYSVSSLPLLRKNVDTEEVEAAKAQIPRGVRGINEDKVRLILTILFVTLSTAFLIIGLIIYLATGNNWLLAAGLTMLTVSTYRMIGYYFHRSKEYKEK